MKALLTIAIVAAFALTSNAVLQLSVTGLTANSITFSISGTVTGDSSLLNSGSNNFLFIEVTENNAWITADETNYSVTSRGILSGNALSTGSYSAKTSNSYGDYISLQFDSSLVSGTTSGTGTPVTLTFGSSVFNTSKVSLSAFKLYWGDTGTEVPFGILQSTSSIPEPSSCALFGSTAALGLVLVYRRVKSARKFS
jgi:hypothetical protein